MSPTRRLARTMLAGVFVSGGINALRQPGPHVEHLTQSGLPDKLPPQVPAALRTPENLVRVNAAADILGGLALVRGTTPRLASFGLMASLAPTTLVAHPFWKEKDKNAKAEQRLHFLQNLAVIGGLLLSVADTGGRESIPHAVGRLSRSAKKQARHEAKRAKKALPVG
ncbi:MAG: hypothetical protein JWO22_3209 [Frankiales bacterium]|nr:hypothetical protein [Frankiales bacterium]